MTNSNKKISVATAALQATHVILYFTGILDKIAQANVYASFVLCAFISIVCFLLSVWMLLPFANYKHGSKYLFIFLAILQIISTIFIFLLPEAGIPPLIQF